MPCNQCNFVISGENFLALFVLYAAMLQSSLFAQPLHLLLSPYIFVELNEYTES